MNILLVTLMSLFLFAGAGIVLQNGNAPVASADEDTQKEEESVTMVQKTVNMHIPSDNQMPWGNVHGSVDNPAEGYPVVIQIHNEEGEPVHFAQTEINEDGSFEHVFRIYSEVPNNQTPEPDDIKQINIFEGDYTVKIFKPVEEESVQEASAESKIVSSSSAGMV